MLEPFRTFCVDFVDSTGDIYLFSAWCKRRLTLGTTKTSDLPWGVKNRTQPRTDVKMSYDLISISNNNWKKIPPGFGDSRVSPVFLKKSLF